MVQSCFVLMAQGVVCDTFHYATNGGEELYLDRYMLDKAPDASRPCLIFAFGGGFVKGVRNHEYYSIYFDRLAREGYVVVSIDYRLGLKNLNPEGNVVDMIGVFQNAVNIAVEDMYAATNYVIANAEEWGVDTTKIVISGSSAGAITSVQAEWMRCNGDERAAVLPADFRYAGVLSYAGAIFSLKGEPKWKRTPAPIMFFHGSADRQVPYDKATLFGIGFYGPKFLAKEFNKQEWPHWFYDIEYHTHQIAGLPMFQNHNEILTFLKDFVKERRPLTITTTVRDKALEKVDTKFKIMDYFEANYAH
jgi:predicted esterase